MTEAWIPTRGTKSQRLARDRLERVMWQESQRAADWDGVRDACPDAWLTLELDADVAEPKEKVTLYLSKSVVKLFRSMGRGWNGRVDRVLETWLQMKIAHHGAMRERMIGILANGGILDGRDAARRADGEKTLAEHWAFVEGVKVGRRMREAEGSGDG